MTYTAFANNDLIYTGDLIGVLTAVKNSSAANTLLFEDQTGKQCDFDMSGSIEEVIARAVPGRSHKGPGRPRLGVVSREISLLPRHWEWLELQSGGASAALRRLVEEARKSDNGATDLKIGLEALGRVITAVAGNEPGFEEAMRHLYARRLDQLQLQIAGWPQGIQTYVRNRLAIVAGMA